MLDALGCMNNADFGEKVVNENIELELRLCFKYFLSSDKDLLLLLFCYYYY